MDRWIDRQIDREMDRQIDIDKTLDIQFVYSHKDDNGGFSIEKYYC